MAIQSKVLVYLRPSELPGAAVAELVVGCGDDVRVIPLTIGHLAGLLREASKLFGEWAKGLTDGTD